MFNNIVVLALIGAISWFFIYQCFGWLIRWRRFSTNAEETKAQISSIGLDNNDNVYCIAKYHDRHDVAHTAIVPVKSLADQFNLNYYAKQPSLLLQYIWKKLTFQNTDEQLQGYINHVESELIGKQLPLFVYKGYAKQYSLQSFKEFQKEFCTKDAWVQIAIYSIIIVISLYIFG